MRINIKMIKKPTYEDLAKHLGVKRGAVQKYPKIKRDLMIRGLWCLTVEMREKIQKVT